MNEAVSLCVLLLSFRQLDLQEAIDEIGKVRWSPPSGEKRVKTMVESREDWCISRQRIWGVPIPAFYDKGSSELDPNSSRAA